MAPEKFKRVYKNPISRQQIELTNSVNITFRKNLMLLIFLVEFLLHYFFFYFSCLHSNWFYSIIFFYSQLLKMSKIFTYEGLYNLILSSFYRSSNKWNSSVYLIPSLQILNVWQLYSILDWHIAQYIHLSMFQFLLNTQDFF